MIITKDSQTYRGEDWYASNNTWNRGNLVNGTGYRQQIEFDQNSFPDGVRFSWEWPATPAKGPMQVRAYPEIVIGNKPWDNLSRSTSADFPFVLSNAPDIDLGLQLDWSEASTKEFNISLSFWLSSSPVSGSQNITSEVMIWVKSGALPPSGKVVDKASDANGNFRVYSDQDHGGGTGSASGTWDYVAVKYDQNLKSPVLHLDDILQYLADRKLISASDWVMSLEIGAEVTGSAGWVDIDDLNLSVSSKSANSFARADGLFNYYDAGGGRDAVAFNLGFANYHVTVAGLEATVSAPAKGDLKLNDVERLQFSDGTLALDLTGNAGQAYRLYQAAFDRAPDTPGLGYWIRELDRGAGDLVWVANNFIISDEFRARYGTAETVSNADFLTHIYNNVLDRAPDAQGFNYWMGELDRGFERERVLASFSESVENKANVAAAIHDGIWFS